MNNPTFHHEGLSKRFLLIGSYPDSVIKFRGALIESLLQAGCQVHVAAPGLIHGSSVVSQLDALGIHTHNIGLRRTGINPVQDIGVLFELCWLIHATKVDYVLGYTIKPVIYGTIAAWITSVPNRFALVTGLGYAFTGEPKGFRKVLRGVIQRLYQFAFACTKKVFFQNPDDELLFRQLKLLKPDIPSIVVNGSGVDVAEYMVTPLPDSPSFLLIARLLGDKGVREYAQAATLVKAKYPEATFRLVGWIDENPDAIRQQELDKWVALGAVEFIGELSDVRPAIAECSVYVLPSYREGTPRTVLEAMAMGRAIITTDAPGCRETVVDGENGYLVPVQDAVSLAEAITKLIENPDRVSSMGARSRQIAEEKYDVHKVNAMMLKEMGLR